MAEGITRCGDTEDSIRNVLSGIGDELGEILRLGDTDETIRKRLPI